MAEGGESTVSDINLMFSAAAVVRRCGSPCGPCTLARGWWLHILPGFTVRPLPLDHDTNTTPAAEKRLKRG